MSNKEFKYPKGVQKSSESINRRVEAFPKEKDPRYEGWQECFRNVRNSSCYGKVKYSC